MAATDSGSVRLQQLEVENRRLRRAVEELSVLNELAASIGALNNRGEVVKKIISRSLRAVDAEQSVITVGDGKPDRSMKTLIRTQVSSSEQDQFHFNQALPGWMIPNKKPLPVNDPPNDDRFRGVPWDSAVHSVICVPMITRPTLKGVLAG